MSRIFLPAKLAIITCGGLITAGCISAGGDSNEPCSNGAGYYGNGNGNGNGGGNSGGNSGGDSGGDGGGDGGGNSYGGYGDTCQNGCEDSWCSWWPWSKNHYPATRYAIPDVMPLGSIVRSHWHMMETNAEASDFVIYRHEFVESSSELTPYGKDHIAEIAARMPTAPFPVVVQRSMHNADPELDRTRREIIVRVLADLGNHDAERRTVVSQPYSNGLNGMEAEQDYGRFRNVRNATQGGAAGR